MRILFLVFGIILILGCASSKTKETTQEVKKDSPIPKVSTNQNFIEGKPKEEPKKEKIEYQLVGTRINSLQDLTPDKSFLVACQIKRNDSGDITEFEIRFVNMSKNPIEFNYFGDEFVLLDKNKNQYKLTKPASFEDYPTYPPSQRYVNPGDGAVFSVFPSQSVSKLKNSEIELLTCSLDFRKVILMMVYSPKKF